MNSCDQLIAKIAIQLPDICTAHDLIKVGVVSNRNILEQYRKKNIGPPFIRLSERKIFYPKQGILKWLKESSNAGSETQAESTGQDEDFPSEPELA